MQNDAFALRKYPRTPHLEGSRLQAGDEDLQRVAFEQIQGDHLVVEEKCDGANSAVSFDADGALLLQSRGHYLTGGYRERHYDLFKLWAAARRAALYERLGKRYILYGEWMYAKHTVYYDRLPHYFLEFDVFDRETGVFLDTPSRRALLAGAPVCSVPVLGEGRFQSLTEVLALLGPSRYIGPDCRAHLKQSCLELGLDWELTLKQTELSGMMEGLYIKSEAGGKVTNRVKYVRGAFWQTMDFSDSHWIDRPILPNGLNVPMEALFE